MSMPRDLVLVRHGQSEGNVATTAAKHGNHAYYTDKYMATPGHQWRLTELGRSQAATIGAWITKNLGAFDHHYVSPFVRTQETAGNLALPNSQWLLNRALRERDWGDIGSMRKDTFEATYPDNFWMQKNDPLYWTPPGGESIAMVAEDRVRNVLNTWHREASSDRVIAVSHGEAMLAFRLVLERLSDTAFAEIEANDAENIKNCEAFHYTRIDPDTNLTMPRLSFVRRARPVQKDGEWCVEVSPWRQFSSHAYSSEELLANVENVPRLIAPTGE